MNNFEAERCCVCFVEFGVPNGFIAKRREDKRSFYCPNGHAMSYHESELDRVRRERDRLKQQGAWYEQRLADERKSRQAAEHQARAFKGVATRMKNRVVRGICPCCNRTFANLARHMAAKHADFSASEITPEGATVQ